MLVETDIIAYRYQYPVSEDLGVRSEHELQASAKIQVFITRPTNK